jgi:hypothetical protein
LFIGIVLHHIPVAFALVSMLMASGLTKQKTLIYLGVFALMTPLGSYSSFLLSENTALNFEGMVNSSVSEGFLQSNTNFYNPDSTINNSSNIDQKKTNESSLNTVKAFVSYTEPLSKKWFIVTDYDIANTVNNSKRFSFDKNLNNEYSTVLVDLSNSLRYNILANKGGISLKYNTKKLVYSLGGKVSYTDLRQYNLINNTEIAQYEVELIDLISANLLKVSDKLYMAYKPRNGQQKKYEAVILEDGSLEVLGQTFSAPSYAALAGIQDAGSDRKTVNGWTSWKTASGQTLADLRDRLLNTATNEN